MKWPDKLRINGIQYDLSYVALEQEVDSEHSQIAQGQITYCPRKVRIAVGGSTRRRQPDDIVETLLHEIVHGLFESAPLLEQALFDGQEERKKEAALSEFVRLLHAALTENNFIIPPRSRPRISD